MKWKKEYTISSGTEKNATSQLPSSSLHLKEWTRYFRHGHWIKFSINKMDIRIIKCLQCSLERFYTVSVELNSEF